ncbi:MAG: glyoxalase [Verrucomicrobiota bacterium]
MPKGEEEKARSFFSGILGMTEDEKPYPLSERGGCWFRKEGAILHVGVEIEFSPQKKAHPAFLVSNLNELEIRLKEEEFEVVWDEALPNRTRFYSTDPFGNRIEFIKDGDGFSQK